MPVFRYEAPPPVQPYQSRYTGTLANLIGSSERAQAATALAQGDASARMWSGIGQQVGNTLNDIVRFKSEQPRRQLEANRVTLEQQAIDREKGRLADEQTLNDAMSPTPDSGIPVTGGQFDQQGTWNADATPHGGMPSRDQILARLPAHLKPLAQKQFQASDDDFAKVQKSRLDLQAAQRKAVDDVTEHLGGLGYHVTQWGGDPLAVRIAVADAEEKYADDPEMLRNIAAFKARIGDGSDAKINMQAATGLANQSEKYAALMRRPEGKTRTIETVDAQGNKVTKIVEDKAGESYPAAPKDPPALGSEPDYLARYAVKIHKATKDLTADDITKGQRLYVLSKHIAAENPNALTEQRRAEIVATILQFPSVYHDQTDTMKSAIAPDLAKAGFTAFGAPSAATKATAERWRGTALQKINENVGLELLTPAQAAAAKAEIEASYRVQIGEGTSSPAPRAAAPAVAAATPPKAAPKTAATAPDLLKTAKPGRYTLSDGSKWIKGKDGVVRPGG